jgi:hypothetical protein
MQSKYHRSATTYSMQNSISDTLLICAISFALRAEEIRADSGCPPFPQASLRTSQGSSSESYKQWREGIYRAIETSLFIKK